MISISLQASAIKSKQEATFIANICHKNVYNISINIYTFFQRFFHVLHLTVFYAKHFAVEHPRNWLTFLLLATLLPGTLLPASQAAAAAATYANGPNSFRFGSQAVASHSKCK